MDKGFDTVAIVGPGLIGGSMGLAIRRRKLAARVVGIGRRASSLRKADDIGAADYTTTDLGEGVKGADLVVLATPVNTFGPLATQLADCMEEGALLTEVGSVKERVIDEIGNAIEKRNDLVFVPTHPMAGSEKKGPENACSDLFEGSVCIFCDTGGLPAGEVKRLGNLWNALGAKVVFMEPGEHDRVVARISHLPHLIAAALVNTLKAGEGKYAGGGLMDTTRVASGNPELWETICRSNPERIKEALEDFSESINGLKEFFSDGDYDGLREWLGEAKERREELFGEKMF